ncbi:MAG: carboxypeptidase-like regulatory domain-containing protein [Bacteroidota bacterium]
MKYKCIPVILLLLLCSFFSFANNVGQHKKDDADMNGMVLEAETGRPIKDVNITAYNNTKKEKITTSSANGGFTLTDLKPGVYRFVFEKEGFEKVIREKIILKLNDAYQLNVQMAEEANIFDMMPSPLRFSSE